MLDLDTPIILTQHFYERGRQRIARSKRMPRMARDAYKNGLRSDQIRDTQLRTRLQDKESIGDTTSRVYKNQVFWFKGNRAITVYPLPQRLHHKV